MTSTKTVGVLEEADRSLSSRVLEAVAAAEATSPLALETPLYEAVDPDALDALFHRGGAEGVVEFAYLGYRVRVRGDGRVELGSLDG